MRPDWRRIPLSRVHKGQEFVLYEGGATFRSTGEAKHIDKEVHVLVEKTEHPSNGEEQPRRAMPHGALVWAEAR